MAGRTGGKGVAAPASERRDAPESAPTILVAEHAGVCYGVERALGMAEDAAEHAEQPVRTLGPLIHNPLVVEELAGRGVREAASPGELEGGTVIIRAHGVAPEVEDEVRARGLNVVDATCPYVKKVHAAAERLVREGYRVVVVGEAGHPEVEGILGHCGKDALVAQTPADLLDADIQGRVGVVVQTTQTEAALQAIVDALLPRASEVRVMNTICTATQERQEAAAGLAGRADVMVVVGGRNSANTRRLASICSERCPRTHHVEDASEVESAWFQGASLVGVTAGASTPAAHIERTVRAIRSATGAAEPSAPGTGA